VAEELGVSPEAVQRIIARQRLVATALPKRDWRIVSDDLIKYVKSGAEDLAMPPLDDNGWLYDEEVRRLAKDFETAIVGATQDQRITAEEVRRRLPPRARELTVRLKLTPVVKAIVDGPVPTKPFNAGKFDKPILTFSSFKEPYVVAELRGAVREIMRNNPRSGFATVLDRLYESPEAYSNLVKQAFDTLREKGPAFRDFVNLPMPPDTAQVTVWYHLYVPDFAPAARMQEFADLAF
jgi:hypothetical protein